MALIEIRDLAKSFGNVKAVDDISLDIESGEFITLLGPSGSGKTTVLRMIAGFEDPDAGSIKLNGEDITHLPPFDRDVNTVFQDYALFPHMSVQENVEYGLRTRKVPKAERAKQALEAIASVKLEETVNRLPHQLSGGQRQRIALARALVLRPRVLLLDEPLGALDRQLREEMQVELKKIQRDAGITFVFVTHDQEEAMRMSDRIVVFNSGRIEQVGTPEQVYEEPRTNFVAGFLGTANIFYVDVARKFLGAATTVSIRPERIRLQAPETKIDKSETSVKGTVQEAAFVGANTIYRLETDFGVKLTVRGSDESSGVAIEVPDIPMHEAMGEFEGELNIVNWSGFVEPAWTDKFTADTGCKVNPRVAGTSDEMVTLMRTGQYDIVSASGDAALRLIVGGDVQPLNLDLIPNFSDDIAAGMKGNIYDTVNGKPYGVPIGRGANLLQYNEDVTGGAPESWDVVWELNTPYKGKITAYDAPIYIADAAVYLMYHKPELGIQNPYALDETQLAAAIDLLKQQNQVIGEYWSDPVAQITSFVGGNTVVGTSWEVLRKFAAKDNLKTTLPVEGSTGCSPEAQAHCDTFFAEDEEFFKRIWPWTTPIETCVDGRKDVKCTSFQEWTNAWATVKG